jgi:hypothetical protein
MKLSEEIKKLNGRVIEIPGAGRNDLPELFKDLGFETVVEVGVYKGEYTKILCDSGLKVYGVDPYMAYDDYNEPNRDFQARQDYLYKRIQHVMSPYKNCEIIRKTSMDAVRDFPDESISAVYIDAHHGFKYVAEDLWEWSKKVKKGGIIAGHDYSLNGKSARDPYVLNVRYVVDAWVKCFNIQPLYILGRHETLPNEIRDKYRSFFWFKK